MMKKLGLMIMVLAIAGSLLMGCSTASKGTESEKKC